MSLELRNKAQILSRVLSDLNYPLMAEHALKETNEEILKGYLCVVGHRISKMKDDNLTNIYIGLKLNF